MIEYLQNLSFWDWLGLAVLLIIFEIFGAGGYLLWIALAASVVGVVVYIFPELSWIWQFLFFSLLAMMTTVIWWRYQRQHRKANDMPRLNRRGRELIGRTLTLHEAIEEGRGKVRVGDGFWLVSGPDLPAGTEVRVVALEGVVLQVEPGNA